MPGHTSLLLDFLLFSHVREALGIQTLCQCVLCNFHYGGRAPQYVVELLYLLVASDVVLEVVCAQLWLNSHGLLEVRLSKSHSTVLPEELECLALFLGFNQFLYRFEVRVGQAIAEHIDTQESKAVDRSLQRL